MARKTASRAAGERIREHYLQALEPKGPVEEHYARRLADLDHLYCQLAQLRGDLLTRNGGQWPEEEGKDIFTRLLRGARDIASEYDRALRALQSLSSAGASQGGLEDSQEWAVLRCRILKALEPHPEASDRLIREIGPGEEDDRGPGE